MKFTKKWVDEEGIVKQSELEEYVTDYFNDHPLEAMTLKNLPEEELMPKLGFRLK